jgi:hypothetical protein
VEYQLRYHYKCSGYITKISKSITKIWLKCVLNKWRMIKLMTNQDSSRHKVIKWSRGLEQNVALFQYQHLPNEESIEMWKSPWEIKQVFVKKHLSGLGKDVHRFTGSMKTSSISRYQQMTSDRNVFYPAIWEFREGYHFF